MNPRGNPKSPATPTRAINKRTANVQIKPRGVRAPGDTGDLELQQPYTVNVHPPVAVPAAQPPEPASQPEAATVNAKNTLQVPGRTFTKQQVAAKPQASTQSDNKHVHPELDHQLNLGVPDTQDETPIPEVAAAPKIKNKALKYSAQSYYAELSMLRNKEMGCFGFFSNQDLIAELSRKMKIWLDNEEEFQSLDNEGTLKYLPLEAQQKLVDGLYKAEVMKKQDEIAKRNFSDDPTGEILDDLKRDLRQYIRNDDRAKRDTQVVCTYIDEKDVERRSVAAGPARQLLLTDLQTSLRDPNPQQSILDIINQWKSAPTKYKKPNTNVYFTNYEFASIKTGYSTPDAKKLIDRYVEQLSAQAAVKNTPKP